MIRRYPHKCCFKNDKEPVPIFGRIVRLFIRPESVLSSNYEAFIQILHVDGNHWIAVEHVSSDCVNIYDSVYSSVSTDTKIQIASLLHTGNQKITLKIHKVQFQDKDSDCGAYSIAFATDLAYGNNPASREYEQN